MSRQIRGQVLRDGDGSHAGPSPTVRNGERLVEVQVSDVSANCRRAYQSDLRVHVRAVHVHLSPMLVDNRAHFANPFFEDPVRRGIRHHQASQYLVMALGLSPQIIDVNVPLLIARDRRDTHACHGGACRIGSMGR